MFGSILLYNKAFKRNKIYLNLKFIKNVKKPKFIQKKKLTLQTFENKFSYFINITYVFKFNLDCLKYFNFF